MKYVTIEKTKMNAFSRTIITKYHRLGRLNRILLSYSFQRKKSKIKMSTDLMSSEVFSLTCRFCLFPMSSHGLSSLCIYILISSSYKDSTHVGVGPNQTTTL